PDGLDAVGYRVHAGDDHHDRRHGHGLQLPGRLHTLRVDLLPDHGHHERGDAELQLRVRVDLVGQYMQPHNLEPGDAGLCVPGGLDTVRIDVLRHDHEPGHRHVELQGVRVADG